MKKSTLVLLALSLLVTMSSNAQSCDPWITKAYQMLYKRNPSSAECNISNYNGGRWNNYPELVGYISAYNRYKPGKHLKGDQWIFRAYAELYNRAPMSLELNINAYNNGRWGNYNELKGYISQMQNSMRNAGVSITEVENCSGDRLVTITLRNKTAFDVISNEEGKILAKGDAAYDQICKALKGAEQLATVMANSTMLAGFEFHDKSTKRVMSAGSQVIPTAGNATLVLQ